MTIVGSALQEKRLEDMGRLAERTAPGFGVAAFKGIFRFAIEAALREHNLSKWEDMESRDEPTKRPFFESMLDAAAVRMFKLGLSAAQIESVKRGLRENFWRTAETS
ncbi:MAG TPA: hypothetical protein VMV90_03535 [Rectinemataceae bacterium]|nr:hypothetical protein [Rectinemataceae bacterium]